MAHCAPEPFCELRKFRFRWTRLRLRVLEDPLHRLGERLWNVCSGGSHRETLRPLVAVAQGSGPGRVCFGRCRRGGTIYDLAAPLYGYGLRGEDFLRLRAEVGRLFDLDAIA